MLNKFLTDCPIVYYTDANFVTPTLVSMFSMIKNYKGSQIDFVVIHRGLSDEEHGKFTHFLQWANAQLQVTLQLYDINNLITDWSGINYSVSGFLPQSHFTSENVEIMFRLWIADIINTPFAVSMDSDTVVIGDLLPLLQYQMPDNIYVRGSKTFTDTSPTFNAWAEGKEWEYMNSGVLQWNLDAIRRDNVIAQFDECMRSQIWQYPDQDIISVVCHGHLEYFPAQYNLESRLRRVRTEYSTQYPFTDEEWDGLYTDPKILHYSARWKPWEERYYKKMLLWEKEFHFADQSYDKIAYDVYLEKLSSLNIF